MAGKSSKPSLLENAVSKKSKIYFLFSFLQKGYSGYKIMGSPLMNSAGGETEAGEFRTITEEYLSIHHKTNM